jgi:2-polyprenyl-3-methyl-5-hydroxy-6-metoxy-1,4-benzoquinol methylase
MAITQREPQPSPALFFDTVNAYQRSAALKAAIELNIFGAIASGAGSPAEIARECGVAERGARVLSDYLTTIGFLAKADGRYRLTLDSATFLDPSSPMYMGSAVRFLNSDELTSNFTRDLAAAVRKGGTLNGEGVMEPDHPIWVEFARSMAPLMMLPSQLIAGLVNAAAEERWKVLDIAAGHGLFGVAIAQRNPNARIVAVDWPSVLAVARENASAAGVTARYSTIEGSAFEADLGTAYDLVLLTNFLHHFDAAANEKLLRKVYAALKPGGRVATLEFVPNADRVSPPVEAQFSLMMLGATASGDAYTFAELDRMFRNAGFSRSELHEIPPSIQHVVMSYK